jgi:hypothetical protein
MQDTPGGARYDPLRRLELWVCGVPPERVSEYVFDGTIKRADCYMNRVSK